MMVMVRRVSRLGGVQHAVGFLRRFLPRSPFPPLSLKGRTEACKVLIKKGNDVNAMANSGGTSLMFAAGAGHTEAATVLLDSGANVNAKLQATPEFLEQVRPTYTLKIIMVELMWLCRGEMYCGSR